MKKKVTAKGLIIALVIAAAAYFGLDATDVMEKLNFNDMTTEETTDSL